MTLPKIFDDGWIAAAVFALLSSLVMLFIAYVSQPPGTLHRAAGKIVAVDDMRPSKHPKLNLFVDDGQNTIRVYTDINKLSTIPAIGDTVEVEYADDFLGRNFHRFWDLRRGGDVLMSKAASMPSAVAESRQISWVAFGCLVFGAASAGVRLLVRARASGAP